MMWGDGVRPGLLTSPSTRTPGLVTNTDFLPTVAAYFGLKPPKGAVGRPMTVVPLPATGKWEHWWRRLRRLPTLERIAGPTPEQWASMHDRWYSQSRKQSVFGGLPTIQALLIIIGIVLAGRRYPTTQRPNDLTTLPLSILPLALLILPVFSPDSLIGSGGLLAVTLLFAAGTAYWKPKIAPRLAVWSLGVLVLVSTLDLLTGANLMRQAWMSYSVMEGARYYGLGNEYAGALFGAMMVLSAAWLQGGGIKRWPVVLAAWGFCIAVIGLPAFGADAGDFLGAAIGVGAAGIVWRRGRLRARDLALILAAAVLLLGALVLFDLSRGTGEQSHIARAIGSGGILNIALRKAALNGYLLLHSVWSLGLIAAIYGFWRLWRGAESRLGIAFDADRGMRGAVTGLASGTVALLLLNDSGIVAASECLMLAYAGLKLLTTKAQSADDSPVTSSPAA